MTSSKLNSKEPYDEFVASIKLVTGEEILTKVIVDNNNEENQIIIDNPLICHEVRSSGANIPMGYKFEPWMKMTDEDVFVLNMNNIVTISEVKEIGVLETYNSVVANGFKRTHPELNRDMGWINSVERSRSIIEKLFKGEDASKEPKKE
tara:strand:+ start:59 stop:505 length:447 start_codon:yes stop_codon:yes gene_type:complete